MPLTLRIENMDSLPDGGPVSIQVDRRGIAIGRDTYLDWTLPDPQRFVSGTHCEVQFRDGGYWLHDRSSNGTHVNDNPQRMTEAHLLKSGDRINIGQYIIAVEVTGEEANAAASAGPGKDSPYGSGDVWGGIDDAAPAGNRQDFRQGPSGGSSGKPIQGDPLEEADWGMQQVADSGPEREPPNKLPPLAGSEPEQSSPPLDAGVFDLGGGSEPSGGAQSQPPSQPAQPPSPSKAPPSADIWGDFGAGSSSSQPSPPPAEEELSLGSAQERREAPPEQELSLGAAQERPAEDPPLDLGAAQERPSQTPPPPRPEPQSPPPAAEKPSGLAAKWGDGEGATEKPPATSSGGGGGGARAAFARGAGIPVDAISQKDEEAFAEDIGRLFRVTCDNLKAMLKARDETKGAMRSADRTMIGAIQNNPLKSLPTTDDAMKIMLGPSTDSYLGALPAIERGFADLQDHQMRVFGAMQQALGALIKDLSPDGIAETTPGDGGLAKIVSSRRAKLWDIYVERYKAKASRHERGMVDAFMLLFAEMYDAQKPR